MIKKGFTLIETLVVVTVVGILVTVIFSTMLSLFKARSRTDVSNILEQNGAFVTSELRRNVLNSIGSSIICPNGGTGDSLTVINRFDGQSTTLSCTTADQISSNSAKLLSAGVAVSDCANFVSCLTMPVTGNIYEVDFNFYLVASNGGDSIDSNVSRKFENKVVIRNY